MQPAQVDTLYILSAGHSGSTLLNLILGSHPRAIAVSELTRLPANIAHDERCTCGVGMRECAHWREVCARLKAKVGVDILADPGRLNLGYIGAPNGIYRGSLAYRTAWKARRFATYLAQFAGVPPPPYLRSRIDAEVRNRLAVYEAVRETSQAAIVVDASKGFIPGIAIYQAQPARMRFILLTRDGRAVFYSNLKRGFGQSYSMRVWRNYYRYGLPIVRRRVDPAHVLIQRYEDLATNPQREVERICAFAGIPYEPSMLQPNSKQHHITSGNNMRFRFEDGIRLDVKWRSELQDADKAYFEKHAGALNRRLGYA
jgi:hypothetical protein